MNDPGLKCILLGALRQTRFSARRPFLKTIFALAALIAAVTLVRRWEDHRKLATGKAQWIWLTRDLEESAPMRFVATRDFDFGGPSRGPARALLFVDRRFVLFVNGDRVGEGEQKPGDPLILLDLTAALQTGRNRLEIEASSPDGAGGILFALELPDGRTIVSDRTWRVGRTRLAILEGAATPAVVWGRPPMYPWGYPSNPSPIRVSSPAGQK